jgi:hypothetical protein
MDPTCGPVGEAWHVAWTERLDQLSHGLLRLSDHRKVRSGSGQRRSWVQRGKRTRDEAARPARPSQGSHPSADLGGVVVHHGGADPVDRLGLEHLVDGADVLKLQVQAVHCVACLLQERDHSGQGERVGGLAGDAGLDKEDVH